MELNLILKDGKELHYDDVTFCEPRMTEHMTEDGTFEADGDALYFEREKDDIGCGTLVLSDDIRECEYNGLKIIFSSECYLDNQLWIAENNEQTAEHDDVDLDDR